MASNDNDDNLPGFPPDPGSGFAPPAAGAVLQMVPSTVDRHTRNLEAMMIGVFGHARETLAQAKHEEDPEVQAVLIKQGVALANCYAQLLGAQDKHRKAVREER